MIFFPNIDHLNLTFLKRANKKHIFVTKSKKKKTYSKTTKQAKTNSFYRAFRMPVKFYIPLLSYFGRQLPLYTGLGWWALKLSIYLRNVKKKKNEGDAAFCLISLVIVTLKLLRYGLFFGRQFLGGITLHLRKLRKHILVSVRSLRLPLCSQFLIPLKNNTQNIGYFATDKDVVHIKSYSTTPNIMGFCKFERDEDSRYFKNFRS